MSATPTERATGEAQELVERLGAVAVSLDRRGRIFHADNRPRTAEEMHQNAATVREAARLLVRTTEESHEQE